MFQGSATFGPGEASQAILTASGISDIFLAKFNSSGLLQWVRQTGGTGIDAGAGIALDGAANIYTTGSFQLTTTFGQGEPNQTQLTAVLDDIYIAGYDSSGALKWAKRAGGNDGDLGARIAVGSGAVYVTGTFQGTATFGPGEANQTSLTGTGLGEIFVAKFEVPNCNVIGFPGVSLQSAIDAAAAGSTISVSGTCNENILIRNEKQRITIDGAGAGAGTGTRATIDAPDDGSPVFNVRGKGILIQNLNITGGNHDVVINRGSNAVLNNNLIQNTGGVAVKVEQLSFAVLTNNAIENNPDDGVSVEENATARIGFNADSETVAGGNVIQNNGGRGIRIGNGAHARIIGNTISGNGDEGIVVERDSSADIASNNISGNQSHGIRVESNSFIMLGEDVGSSIYETPNSTSVNNGGFGIRCDDGGVLDGQQGTLNGNLGATGIRSTCVNSLI